MSMFGSNAGWANIRREESEHRPIALGSHRDGLEKASRNHATLVKSWESLLIHRQQVRASGKQLRDRRVEASDAEAELMGALREYAILRQESLPSSILEAYQKV